MYTIEEFKFIKNFKMTNKHICHYCNKEIIYNEDLTVDHKLPVSKGGKTIKSNLVISCSYCNTEKADMTEEEYLKYKIENPTINNSLAQLLNSQEKLNKLKEEFLILNNKKLKLEQIILYDKLNAAQICKCHKLLKQILFKIENINVEINKIKPIVEYLKKHKTELMGLNHKVLNAQRQNYINKKQAINNLINLNDFVV